MNGGEGEGCRGEFLVRVLRHGVDEEGVMQDDDGDQDDDEKMMGMIW